MLSSAGSRPSCRCTVARMMPCTWAALLPRTASGSKMTITCDISPSREFTSTCGSLPSWGLRAAEICCACSADCWAGSAGAQPARAAASSRAAGQVEEGHCIGGGGILPHGAGGYLKNRGLNEAAVNGMRNGLRRHHTRPLPRSRQCRTPSRCIACSSCRVLRG